MSPSIIEGKEQKHEVKRMEGDAGWSGKRAAYIVIELVSRSVEAKNQRTV